MQVICSTALREVPWSPLEIPVLMSSAISSISFVQDVNVAVATAIAITVMAISIFFMVFDMILLIHYLTPRNVNFEGETTSG